MLGEPRLLVVAAMAGGGAWGEEGELTTSKVQAIHTGGYWSPPKFLVAYAM